MQVQVLSGIYSDKTSQLRVSLPRNYIPVPTPSGISNGFLAPSPGLEVFSIGPGLDRGGINWNGKLYRVMGSKLISVNEDGAVTELGDVGNNGKPVSLDYSFDRLSIASNNRLYYWDGGTFSQVTDPDLGIVIDQMFIGGYFMTTDGTSLVVTDLDDPFAVNPLKYGSSESDPDPVKAVKRIRTEAVALNRYTLEYFQNVGGDFFPFQRIDGAMVQKGCVGTHACCNYAESVAFVGGGRNEAPGVYFALSGTAQKLSTREIDILLAGYSEEQLAACVLEEKIDKAHKHLMLHLPDQCLVFDAAATEALGTPIWFTLTSSVVGLGQYRSRNHVWVYDKWIGGDPTSTNISVLTDLKSTHYGEVIGWDFATAALYTEGTGAIVHNMELVGLPGGVEFGKDPVIWTSYSLDGAKWSQERPIQSGKFGETLKRLCWRRQGFIRNWRVQKFRGTSDNHQSIVRLEMELEKLGM